MERAARPLDWSTLTLVGRCDAVGTAPGCSWLVKPSLTTRTRPRQIHALLRYPPRGPDGAVPVLVDDGNVEPLSLIQLGFRLIAYG